MVGQLQSETTFEAGNYIQHENAKLRYEVNRPTMELHNSANRHQSTQPIGDLQYSIGEGIGPFKITHLVSQFVRHVLQHDARAQDN